MNSFFMKNNWLKEFNAGVQKDSRVIFSYLLTRIIIFQTQWNGEKRN